MGVGFQHNLGARANEFLKLFVAFHSDTTKPESLECKGGGAPFH